MRIIFMGTPDFAVPSLLGLISSRHEVVAVVTQPDRRRSRGEVSFSPVKECALGAGIPVLQYEKVSKEGISDIRALNPDIIVTAAFGQMLSQEFLEIAPYGVVNVHASLLPKYRGSSPIQWAVINGEHNTGVTIMKTAYKMDSGDMILTRETDIGKDETAGELFDRLATVGRDALLDALEKISAGTAVFTPQDERAATYFPMLKKADGLLDFNMPAQSLKNRVRGFNPWPSAFTYFGGKLLKIHKVDVICDNGRAGEILSADAKSGIVVACGEGALRLLEIQPENGKRMSAESYLLGHKIPVGSFLGE